MDDFTRTFFQNSINIIDSINTDLDNFFDTHVRFSQDAYPTVETLRIYRDVHFSTIHALETELGKIEAIQSMGLDSNDEVETEEDQQIYIDLETGLILVRRKVELLLSYFIDNLGAETVKEVLDRE